MKKEIEEVLFTGEELYNRLKLHEKLGWKQNCIEQNDEAHFNYHMIKNDYKSLSDLLIKGFVWEKTDSPEFWQNLYMYHLNLENNEKRD